MKKRIIAPILMLAMLITLITPINSAEAAFSPDKIISEGKKYIGTRYQYGGSTPKGFDCSGFVAYTYKKATGITLPRTAAGMFQKGKAVHKSKLQKGDLVFFSTYKKGASHAGIYIGNNQFIHASSSKGVKIDSLNSSYWKNKYIGAKRL
ncbi:C40 family peptidase [Peribacillus tepidiphilus]|uniref:C40 family peptidase n=1 Tax=Peribacillus tepidiphilus TaxID=2652445 RepID=UPI00129090F7|nr:C40 family peptidase [Peribacillus tepidiphilus]